MKRIFPISGAGLVAGQLIPYGNDCKWTDGGTKISFPDGREICVEDLLKYFVVFWETHIESAVYGDNCRWIGPYPTQKIAMDLVTAIEQACAKARGDE